MKLRVLIVDDEPLARERMRRLLEADGDIEILAECGDGPSAVEAVGQHQPDLLFLDIQMPGMDGFGVVRALGTQKAPQVVFVTAFDQHAVRAFEERALDYLLKPVSKARLKETLARARERMTADTQGKLPAALLDLLASRESAGSKVRQLAVRTPERTIFVRSEDVDWVEAAGNYAVLHVGKDTHIIRETMSSLETQLPAEVFLRVSRSAIINLRRVRELQALMPGEHVAILTSGQRVPLTRNIREVEERLRFVG
jgi:two-component system LytT family response regulator